jgi:hypothetical protein
MTFALPIRGQIVCIRLHSAAPAQLNRNGFAVTDQLSEKLDRATSNASRHR